MLFPMARRLAQPNPENASTADLHAAVRAGSYETQRRCMAIIMLITGIEREQVCRAMEVCDSAVRKWIRAFNERGIDGLILRKRPGAPRKISKETCKQMVEELKETQESDEPFPTAKIFHGYVREKYKIECSYPTLMRTLHEEKFVFKVPQTWPDRQDEEKREVFRQELRPLNEDPECELWYSDETGIEGEPKPRRRLAPKGSKPRVTRNGDHVRLSVIGLVCPRTGEFFSIEASHCDTDVFQAFLDEAARQVKPSRKRNILILDNASWHKTKSLNWHFFEPMYLPPYSPDFNPIERLWLVMKSKWFANIRCKNQEALIERADKALLDLIRNPEDVAKTTAANATDL
jgi:transposase